VSENKSLHVLFASTSKQSTRNDMYGKRGFRKTPRARRFRAYCYIRLFPAHERQCTKITKRDERFPRLITRTLARIDDFIAVPYVLRVR